jgi:hypothetical protein
LLNLSLEKRKRKKKKKGKKKVVDFLIPRKSEKQIRNQMVPNDGTWTAIWIVLLHGLRLRKRHVPQFNQVVPLDSRHVAAANLQLLFHNKVAPLYLFHCSLPLCVRFPSSNSTRYFPSCIYSRVSLLRLFVCFCASRLLLPVSTLLRFIWF